MMRNGRTSFLIGKYGGEEWWIGTNPPWLYVTLYSAFTSGERIDLFLLQKENAYLHTTKRMADAKILCPSPEMRPSSHGSNE